MSQHITDPNDQALCTLVAWMRTELGSEFDQAIATGSRAQLDDAVLDALGLILLYLGTLPRARRGDALDSFRHAMVSRGREPLPGMELVIENCTYFEDKLRSIALQALTRHGHAYDQARAEGSRLASTLADAIALHHAQR